MGETKKPLFTLCTPKGVRKERQHYVADIFLPWAVNKKK